MRNDEVTGVEPSCMGSVPYKKRPDNELVLFLSCEDAGGAGRLEARKRTLTQHREDPPGSVSTPDV